MKLTEKDKKLIQVASTVIHDNIDLYEKELIVGCALRMKSGKVYTGINIKTSHSICAEQVAIGQALANGEREFDTIVAVKFDKEGNNRVVSPCGLCRYIMNDLHMDMNVIVEDIKNGRILKVKASKLLPYPYKRNN